MIFAADDIYVAQNIGFGIIAAIMIVGALRVVTSKNVVHAALSMAPTPGAASLPHTSAQPTKTAQEKTMPSHACGHQVMRFMKG